MKRALAVLLFIGGGLPPPAPGVACGDAGPMCTSDAGALACRGGVWEAVACPGPLGCQQSYRHQSIGPRGQEYEFWAGFICDWRGAPPEQCIYSAEPQRSFIVVEWCGLEVGDAGTRQRCLTDGGIETTPCSRCLVAPSDRPDAPRSLVLCTG